MVQTLYFFISVLFPGSLYQYQKHVFCLFTGFLFLTDYKIFSHTAAALIAGNEDLERIFFRKKNYLY
jgi:hypothetical protein